MMHGRSNTCVCQKLLHSYSVHPARVQHLLQKPDYWYIPAFASDQKEIQETRNMDTISEQVAIYIDTLDCS